MVAKFRADGDSVDYTPVADVAAGAMVKVGSGASAKIGVALNAIAANKLGALRLVGLFRLPYSFGASIPVALGAELDVNFTTQLAQPAGAGDANVSIYAAGPITTSTGEADFFINSLGS